METKKKMGFSAFIPLIVLIIGSLLYVILAPKFGFAGPDYQLPFIAVVFICAVITFFMGRFKLEEKIKVFAKSAGEPMIMQIIMIFLLAGCFTKVSSTMGGNEALVNITLSVLPSAAIYCGMFLASGILATAMGTSIGTMAALCPMAIGLVAQGGLDINIALAAIVSGAICGDNLSMVSDTTIAATKGVGCDMKDKFKMNFFIILAPIIITAVIFVIIGHNNATPVQVDPITFVSVIKVVPYVFIIVASLLGLNVNIVLLIGIALSGIIGFATGALNIITFLFALQDGMKGMVTALIIVLLIQGMMGLIRHYGGVDWLIQKLVSGIKSQRGAQFGVLMLSFLLAIAMGTTTYAILTAAPLAKDIQDRYNIDPKRTASLLDLGATGAMGFVFWGGFMMFAASIAGGDTIVMIKYSFYSLLVLIASIISIFVGKKKKAEQEAEN